MFKKIIFPLVLISLTACTTASIVGRGSTPILLNTPDKKIKVIETFEDGYISAFNYGNNYDISEIISDQLKKQRCVCRCKLKSYSKTKFLECFIKYNNF